MSAGLFTDSSSPPATGINIVLTNVPCDSSVIVTDAVRMVAGTAVKAQADNVSNSNVIGVVQSKSTATLCDIRVAGVTPPIFSGLDETKEYVLSALTAGLIVPETSAPSASGNVVLRLGQPFDAQRMFIFKGFKFVRA